MTRISGKIEEKEDQAKHHWGMFKFFPSFCAVCLGRCSVLCVWGSTLTRTYLARYAGVYSDNDCISWQSTNIMRSQPSSTESLNCSSRSTAPPLESKKIEPFLTTLLFNWSYLSLSGYRTRELSCTLCYLCSSSISSSSSFSQSGIPNPCIAIDGLNDALWILFRDSCKTLSSCQLPSLAAK